MDWSLLPALDAFPSLRERWDAANERLCGGHPLLHSDFVGPLLTHFASGDEQLARLNSDDDGTGLALLTRRMPFAWQTFLPGQQRMGPLLVSPVDNALETLVQALPAPALMLDVLAQDPLFSPHTHPAGSHREVTLHSTTITADLQGTFDAYWNVRSSRLRKRVDRDVHNAAASVGRPRLVTHHREADILDALNRYGQLESRGWKGHEGTAVHPDNVQGRFYADVLAAFARRGEATVYELYLGSQLAASRITIARGRMLVSLKITYNEDLSQYRPGWLLLHAVLRTEFDAGRFSRIEFYTSATPEQRGWATSSRSIMNVTVYRRDWSRWLVTTGRVMLRVKRPSKQEALVA